MQTQAPDHLIRVVRGRPDTDELAALTAVVLARAAALEGEFGGTAGSGPAVAGWCRSGRPRDFLGPRTWRAHRAGPRPA
ncbi:acyl-CoA carboxylase epsilon subunit [Streptomyces sp. NPDC048507]|uniref:acyl-CoA carboxylase epsilon subunit n=1 Tax=Streptomyces sp. NPDC048507 TaxID=3365560 RepID=UPI00371195D5